MEKVKLTKQAVDPSLEKEKINTENTADSQNAPSTENIRVRFSDEELLEFKELILAKMEEAKKDYALFKNTLSLQDDNGTNDTSPTFKVLEDASDVLSKEETSQLAKRQEDFIQHLYYALVRIENKSYGTCRITGKLIAKERLTSVPHATTCIDAKRDSSNL